MLKVNQLIGFGAHRAAAGGGDSNFANVILLWSADNGSTIPDESSHAYGNATLTGSAASSTSSPLVGAGSLLTSGSDGSAYWANTSGRFNMNTPSDAAAVYTVEGLIKLTTLGTFCQSGWGGVGSTGWFISASAGDGSVRCFTFNGTGGTGYDFSTAASVVNITDQFYVCLESNGSKARFYAAKIGTDTSATMKSSSTAAGGSYRSLTIAGGGGLDHIAFSGSTIAPFSTLARGRFDEWRLTKGVARYDNDAGFVLPTFPFPRS